MSGENKRRTLLELIEELNRRNPGMNFSEVSEAVSHMKNAFTFEGVHYGMKVSISIPNNVFWNGSGLVIRKLDGPDEFFPLYVP